MSSLNVNIASDFDNLQMNMQFEMPLEGITGIFGPSGSGKTSLLKTIAGINQRIEGIVSLGGVAFLDSQLGINLPAEQRQVSGVFQQDGLFPHLNVLNNLRYAIKRRSTQQIELESIVKEAGLEPLLEKMISQLSGGERQKVAIARALLAEPKLLILDEPVTALDRINKLKILKLIKRLQAQFKLPILYVSHNLEEIQALADNLIVINNGQVINQGNVHRVIHQLNHGDLIERQTSLSVNKVESDNHFGLVELAISSSASIFAVDEHFSMEPEDNYRCYILARDISVSVSRPDQSSIVNQVEGVIAAIEINQNQVLLSISHHKQLFYVTISTYSLDKLSLCVNDSIYMQFKASAVRQALY